MSVEIRRASGLFTERGEGRLSRHSLSFGARYDPDNLRFGPMVCHDDHLLGDGRGFDPHHHADLVIVSWVVSGALRHTDSAGTTHTVEAGQAAVLVTGSGVEHSEVAAAPQTRFVQVWLAPESPGSPDELEASYDVLAPHLEPGALTRVAEPLPGARFAVARLEAGESITVPAAARAHLYVARGALLRSSMAEPLADGDAFRFTDEGEHEVSAAVPSELLLWTFDEPGEPGGPDPLSD